MTSFASCFRDRAYGLRVFRRTPGFAAAVVLTAAIGIAANAAVFTVLNALLFRPLPITQPDEIVRVYTSEGRVPRAQDLFGNSSYADYFDLRQLGVPETIRIGVDLRVLASVR